MARIIFFLILQCLVSSFVWGLNVDIPAATYEVARGDSITLPCNFQPKNAVNSVIIIYWLVDGNTPDDPEGSVLTYFSTGEIDIPSDYEGRASPDIDIKSGKANLKLSSVTLAENKKFECRVTIPNDDKGKVADTTRLVVLVAPSIPCCSIQGKAEYGQNINLTCISEEGSPAPTYKWEGRDVENKPRVPDPRTTDVNGIMSLYNISKDTSGYYYCTSRNKIRSATCNITLTVMPPSINIASAAGIIGGVLAAAIALIIIIYCCCCRKKKDDGEEYAMGVPEEEFRDKESVENGAPRQKDQPDEVQSEYDDRSVRGPPGRRSDYDDRRSDYDDRRSDYDDRRSDYSDRRERYEADGRSHDDRRYGDDSRYDDRRDRRYNDDRYDTPYDERDRPPIVPANKPPRVDK